MSEVQITYGSRTFNVSYEEAAATVVLLRIAVDNGQSVVRNFINRDGSGASLLLGPGCPISFEADDLKGLLDRARELGPEIAEAWAAGRPL